MKILVVVAFPFYQPSGSSHNALYKIKALQELGHDITILTYPHGENINGLKFFRYPGIRFFKDLQPGEYVKKIMYDSFLFFGFLFQLLIHKYQVVICHGTMYYWGILLIPFSRAYFIANVHNNLDNDLIKWAVTKNNSFLKLAKYLEIKVINNYRCIICGHSSIYDRYIEDGISPGKLVNIRSCVKSIKKDNWLLPGNKKLKIVYTGTFVNIQNIELLYSTAVILINSGKEFEFVLIGATEAELEEGSRVINKMNLSGYVTILKREKHDKLEKYYRNADILISPRTFGKDTPMKIFDYMNTGICILAADRPIHHEVLNKNNSFLFEPNPEKLAEAIVFLSDHPDVRIELGRKAKYDFETNYSFEVMKNKYENLLNSIKCCD